MKKYLFVLFFLFSFLPSAFACTTGGEGYSTVKQAVQADEALIVSNGGYPQADLSSLGNNTYEFDLYNGIKTGPGGPYHQAVYTVEYEEVAANANGVPGGSCPGTAFAVTYYADGTNAITIGQPSSPTCTSQYGINLITTNADTGLPAGSMTGTGWGINAQGAIQINAPLLGSSSYNEVSFFANATVQQQIQNPTQYSCYTFTINSKCGDILVLYQNIPPAPGTIGGGEVWGDCSDTTCMDVPFYVDKSSSYKTQNFTDHSGSQYHVQYNPATGCIDQYVNGVLQKSFRDWIYSPDVSSTPNSGSLTPYSSDPGPVTPTGYNNVTSIIQPYGNTSSTVTLRGIKGSGFGPYTASVFLKPANTPVQQNYTTNLYFKIKGFGNATSWGNISFPNWTSTRGVGLYTSINYGQYAGSQFGTNSDNFNLQSVQFANESTTSHSFNSSINEPSHQARLVAVINQMNKVFPLNYFGSVFAFINTVQGLFTPVRPTYPISFFGGSMDPLKYFADIFDPILLPVQHIFEVFITLGFIFLIAKAIMEDR